MVIIEGIQVVIQGRKFNHLKSVPGNEVLCIVASNIHIQMGDKLRSVSFPQSTTLNTLRAQGYVCNLSRVVDRK